METTLYIAMIESEDGVHIFRHNCLDDDPASFEDFEIFCQDKADELEGELFGPYAADSVVEETTIPDGPCPTVNPIDEDEEE